MKEQIKRIPIFGDLARRCYRVFKAKKSALKPFPGSENYWEARYSSGENSGVGSYGKFSAFKAAVINDFVDKNGIGSVIEFGCGDGNQLTLANYPTYIGFDVSESAVSTCRSVFSADKSKQFRLMTEYDGEKADLTVSLDVIYHLIEDEVFQEYMRVLFESSRRYVVVYASNTDDNRGYEGTHVKHREFTSWVQHQIPHWELIEHIPNKYPYEGDFTQGSFADFYIYARGQRDVDSRNYTATI